MATDDLEAAALFTLLRHSPRGTSWGSIAASVAFEGSALTVLNSDDEAGLFPRAVDTADLRPATETLKQWRSAGYRMVTVLDDDYPARLLDIRETPPFLFYSGNLCRQDDGMSVVGSRAASEHGLRSAADAARLLVSEGLTVIGGLAAGIDTAAHRAALDAGGRTVAFIGTGIARSYPAQNAALQREIADRGLVLSQFYPDAPPTKQTFPIRNAAMSGYGLATIVVEAGEHSGTRIQARLAGEHGRPVILTSHVVESTSWGRALVGSPHVHVVRDIDELAAAIRRIRQVPIDLEHALAALSSS